MSDERFIQDLSSEIPEFKTKHDYLDVKGLYRDMIKIEVRGFCVQYTKRKNKERRNTEKHLQQQTDHLMNQLKTDRTKENLLKLYRFRAEYDAIAEYRTKGALVRSMAKKNTKYGEKITKYFLNMEKRQHCKSHISKLKTNNDMEINEPKTILEQGKMFYKNLYTAAHCNDSNYKLFFENSNIAKLEATQQEELERPLLNEECFLILKQCSKNKAPGTDGLSVKFSLRFWSLLGSRRNGTKS